MIDLREIISQYPRSAATRAQLASLLHDLYPTEKRSINIALDVFDSGIATRISSLMVLDKIQVHGFIKQLVDEYGLQEQYAFEGLKMWAFAFGIQLESSQAYIRTNEYQCADNPDRSKTQSSNLDGETTPSPWFSGAITECNTTGYTVVVPCIGKGFLPYSLSSSNALSIGQSVSVKIYPDDKNARIVFSMRKDIIEIWAEVRFKYQDNEWYNGVVVMVCEHGFFVRLEDRVDGLVHKSNIPDYYEGIIREKYNVGTKVAVKVLDVDTDKRRISLSLK